nr:uncharacterized protein LOC118878477 [Drosophila suzukii]
MARSPARLIPLLQLSPYRPKLSITSLPLDSIATSTKDFEGRCPEFLQNDEIIGSFGDTMGFFVQEAANCGQDVSVYPLRGIALWKFTTFDAVASFIAFKKVYFEKWSTTINIQACPLLDLGYLPRKSMYSFWNGLSVSTLLPIPTCIRKFGALDSLHTSQLRTYSRTWMVIPGQ